jgi:hypothetical protein
MSRGLGLLVPALLLVSSACARSGGDEVAPTTTPVTIEVLNRYALPVDVYAFGSGISQRLGVVEPGMRADFSLPQNMIGGGAVRFEARPGGSGQPFTSGEILLAPGSVVDFVVAPQLFNSTVTRRP